MGGGPGGLSTAIALSQIANVEVALYEQAKVLREVGAGISIGPNTWNVLELLGVADTLTSGHETSTVLNMYEQGAIPGLSKRYHSLTSLRNGKTGEEVHRMERGGLGSGKRPNIRTQRTKLQSALLSHVKPGVIQLSKKLISVSDQGEDGVELHFQDGTVTTADLVVGADGIRSVGSSLMTQSNDHATNIEVKRLLETQHGRTMRSSSQGQRSGGHYFPGTTSRTGTIGLALQRGGMVRRHMSTSRL